MNNNFNEENIKKIVAWKDYIDHGHYGDAKDIVDTYNQVFSGMRQVQTYTTCGSCLRRYVMNMWGEYQQYLQDKEAEKLKALETIDEFMTEDDTPAKPTKTKKPKKD